MKKVVLAYSGGLDTSVAIKWLRDRGYEVVAYMADVGQEKTTRAAIDRAKTAGASKVVVKDLKKKFVTDYIWPALKADAVYEGRYTLATALHKSGLLRLVHYYNHTAVYAPTEAGRAEVALQVESEAATAAE